MKPNFFVLREKMARFFQIDVWFATFAHAAKVKCGSVLTPILRAVSVLLTEVLLKNIVGRARPFADESSVFYTYWTDAGSLPAGGYSFPSGHTAAAMAFATALFFSFRKDLSWLFFLLPLAMGFSRVYFQEHYLTDVVASFAVGFLCGLIAVYVVQLLLHLTFFRRFSDAKGLEELLCRRRQP